MATVGIPKHTNKLKAYLIGLGLVGLLELIALLIALGAGNQSYEDTLNWFTSINITLAVTVVVAVYINKYLKRAHKTQQTTKSQSKWRSLTLTIMWLVLLPGTFLGWHEVAFPRIVNFGMQHSGVDATAIITKVTYYQFQGEGRGGSYVSVDSPEQADSVQLKVTYDGHISTITLHDSDTNFDPINSRLQEGNRRLPVRYLRLLPGIVRIATISF